MTNIHSWLWSYFWDKSISPSLTHLLAALLGLVDEQQKVRTITALALAALAEAATPYGIESFDSVLKPLWKGIRQHRGKVNIQQLFFSLTVSNCCFSFRMDKLYLIHSVVPTTFTVLSFTASFCLFHQGFWKKSQFVLCVIVERLSVMCIFLAKGWKWQMIVIEVDLCL